MTKTCPSLGVCSLPRFDCSPSSMRSSRSGRTAPALLLTSPYQLYSASHLGEGASTTSQTSITSATPALSSSWSSAFLTSLKAYTSLSTISLSYLRVIFDWGFLSVRKIHSRWQVLPPLLHLSHKLLKLCPLILDLLGEVFSDVNIASSQELCLPEVEDREWNSNIDSLAVVKTNSYIGSVKTGRSSLYSGSCALYWVRTAVCMVSLVLYFIVSLLLSCIVLYCIVLYCVLTAGPGLTSRTRWQWWQSTLCPWSWTAWYRGNVFWWT